MERIMDIVQSILTYICTGGLACLIGFLIRETNRNNDRVLYFDAWKSGAYTAQIKVKKNDVIRISQNSINDSTRWLIGNLLLLK